MVSAACTKHPEPCTPTRSEGCNRSVAATSRLSRNHTSKLNESSPPAHERVGGVQLARRVLYRPRRVLGPVLEQRVRFGVRVRGAQLRLNEGQPQVEVLMRRVRSRGVVPQAHACALKKCGLSQRSSWLSLSLKARDCQASRQPWQHRSKS